MKTLNVTEQNSLDQLVREGIVEDVLVVRNGTPVALLVPFDEDDVYWYTREHDPAFIASIARAREQAKQGQTAQLPVEYRTTYLTCVRRGAGFNRFEIYRMPLRENLPAIRIPLRECDADIVLDIQRLVEIAYSEGRYDDIDYTQPLAPPLSQDDAAWVDELLRAAGRA